MGLHVACKSWIILYLALYRKFANICHRLGEVKEVLHKRLYARL